MATSLGFDGYNKNVGSMRNTGIDLTLGVDIFKDTPFTWNLTLLGSTIKNKVLQLADKPEIISGSYIIREGETLYSFYTATAAGVDPATGEQLYWAWDTDENGVKGKKYITNDMAKATACKEIQGSRIPDLYGSINNTFKYKGFDLSIFFQWSYGNDVLNANRLFFENVNNSRNLNQYATYADRWTPENPTSNIPVAKNSSSNKVVSSRVIEDGSFLRLKTLTLGYTLPKKALRKWGISTARVYVAGQNLWTISGYSGYDPEVSIRNSALTPGLDYSAYPRAYAVNFGINLGF